MRLLRELLWDNPFQPWMLKTLVVVNALGSVYGYWWYRQQLAETSPLWWPFVTDSPLSSTLMALALYFLWRGKRGGFFFLLAYTAVVKYGLWAVALISDYWLRGGPVAPTELMLWISHLGMALEGFLYGRHLRVRPLQALAIGAWMLWNDWLDYGWGIHPYLFRNDQVGTALVAAVFLSVSLFLLAWRRAAAGRGPVGAGEV